MFGRLRIVPSADLGDTGPALGQALVYDWRWTYAAQGLLLWLALALAMALPRFNRDRRVLLILVPVVVVTLSWVLFKKATGATSSAAYRFDVLADSLLVGLAVLWLLAPGLVRLSGITRFLGSLGILVGAACVGCLSYTGFSTDMVAFLILLILLGLVLLVAMAGAAWRSKPWGGPVRFMLKLGAWTVMGGLGVICGYFLVVVCLSSGGLQGGYLIRALPQIVLVGLILGVCLYVLNLPFMLLGFTSLFFRERLYGCLGLEPVSKDPDTAPPPQRTDTPGDDAARWQNGST